MEDDSEQSSSGAEDVERASAPEDRNVMNSYLKFISGDLLPKEIPYEHLFQVAKICCKDRDFPNYFKVMRQLNNIVTHMMADDIYELFTAMEMDSWIIDDLFKKIENQFSITEWQSGHVIPISLRIWMNEASEDALKADSVFLDRNARETGKESWMFLPRSRLDDHLTTHLSKHDDRSIIHRKLLRKYPRHVREFIRDPKCLQNVSNRDILFELLKLASEIEIEELYFRAYDRMLKLELPLVYIPPLHQYEFSAEEVLQQQKSDQSPFTILIAADGKRGKALTEYLLSKSEYFSALSNFHLDQSQPFVRTICKDIKVLDAWIQFMHTQNLSHETEDETLVKLIFVADYYQMEDEMLFEVFSMLNDRLRTGNAEMIYKHLPFHDEEKQNDKLGELIRSMKERLERDFPQEILWLKRPDFSIAPPPTKVPTLSAFVLPPSITYSRYKTGRKYLNKCSCGVLLHQAILKSSTISDCKFFIFNIDYTFDRTSDSFSYKPKHRNLYLHQRKIWYLEFGKDNFVLDLDTNETTVLEKLYELEESTSFVFYSGTMYAIVNRRKGVERIYRYDIKGNLWIYIQKLIDKRDQIRFHGEFLVFGDLLVAIYEDDWIAYLRPSPKKAFELELDYFETSYPENTFKGVIGIPMKKLTKEGDIWLVFKKSSFLILRADDFKLLAEIKLPLINEQLWKKAAFSGEDLVYLVLDCNSTAYLDVYQVMIELNESDFQRSKVELRNTTRVSAHERKQTLFYFRTRLGKPLKVPVEFEEAEHFFNILVDE